MKHLSFKIPRLRLTPEERFAEGGRMDGFPYLLLRFALCRILFFVFLYLSVPPWLEEFSNGIII